MHKLVLSIIEFVEVENIEASLSSNYNRKYWTGSYMLSIIDCIHPQTLLMKHLYFMWLLEVGKHPSTVNYLLIWAISMGLSYTASFRDQWYFILYTSSIS